MVEGITAEHKVFPKCLNFEIIQRRKISTKVFARGKGECGGLSAGNPLVLDSNVSSMDKTKQNKTKKGKETFFPVSSHPKNLEK